MGQEQGRLQQLGDLHDDYRTSDDLVTCQQAKKRKSPTMGFNPNQTPAYSRDSAVSQQSIRDLEQSLRTSGNKWSGGTCSNSHVNHPSQKKARLNEGQPTGVGICPPQPIRPDAMFANSQSSLLLQQIVKQKMAEQANTRGKPSGQEHGAEAGANMSVNRQSPYPTHDNEQALTLQRQLNGLGDMAPGNTHLPGMPGSHLHNGQTVSLNGQAKRQTVPPLEQIRPHAASSTQKIISSTTQPSSSAPAIPKRSTPTKQQSTPRRPGRCKDTREELAKQSGWQVDKDLELVAHGHMKVFKRVSASNSHPETMYFQVQIGNQSIQNSLNFRTTGSRENKGGLKKTSYAYGRIRKSFKSAPNLYMVVSTHQPKSIFFHQTKAGLILPAFAVKSQIFFSCTDEKGTPVPLQSCRVVFPDEHSEPGQQATPVTSTSMVVRSPKNPALELHPDMTIAQMAQRFSLAPDYLVKQLMGRLSAAQSHKSITERRSIWHEKNGDLFVYEQEEALVGRTESMPQLKEILGEPSKSAPSVIVNIVGRHGIGKSAFVHHFCTDAHKSMKYHNVVTIDAEQAQAAWETIASKLKKRESRHVTKLDVGKRLINNAPSLLIIDSATESSVDTVLHELFGADGFPAHGLQVLAVSRVPISVSPVFGVQAMRMKLGGLRRSGWKMLLQACGAGPNVGAQSKAAQHARQIVSALQNVPGVIKHVVDEVKAKLPHSSQAQATVEECLSTIQQELFKHDQINLQFLHRAVDPEAHDDTIVVPMLGRDGGQTGGNYSPETKSASVSLPALHLGLRDIYRQNKRFLHVPCLSLVAILDSGSITVETIKKYNTLYPSPNNPTPEKAHADVDQYLKMLSDASIGHVSYRNDKPWRFSLGPLDLEELRAWMAQREKMGDSVLVPRRVRMRRLRGILFKDLEDET